MPPAHLKNQQEEILSLIYSNTISKPEDKRITELDVL